MKGSYGNQVVFAPDLAGFNSPQVNSARWPRLMNRDEVAESLSVSARHIDTLVAQGLIPAACFRPSARLGRWHKEAIDAALNNRISSKARHGRSCDAVMAASGQRAG